MYKAEAAFSSVIIFTCSKLQKSSDQYLHLFIFQIYLIYYIANQCSMNERPLI